MKKENSNEDDLLPVRSQLSSDVEQSTGFVPRHLPRTYILGI